MNTLLKGTGALALVLALGCGRVESSPCAQSCAGCCDATGVCQPGFFDTACGTSGAQCTQCDISQTCGSGTCRSRIGDGPGGGAGGGGSGGGGGQAGGSGGGGATPVTSRCAGSMILCGGECVDPSTDESHCGACNRGCAAGLVCNSGVCEALPSDCVAKHCPGDYGCNPQTRTCMDGCFSDADCRGGAKCNFGRCDCPSSAVACGDTCVTSGVVSSSSCLCHPGFEGRGQCVDVDECARGLAQCTTNSTCKNEVGSYRCECNPGYRQYGSQCVVDECARNNGGCSPNASCYQSGTLVQCTCKSGYVGDGKRCDPFCYQGGTCADPSLACYPRSSSQGSCEVPGSGGIGAHCTNNTDCARGTRCERLAGAVTGFCAELCYSSTCSSGSCLSVSGVYECLSGSGQACDALAQNCSGMGCYPTSQGDICAYAGSVAVGGTCNYANDCVKGAGCFANVCHQLCDLAAPVCTTGSCLPVTGATYGACG